MDYQYPKGAVVALLPTDFVTDATRKALKERLQENEYHPLFFDPANFECLSVVCDRLIAQDSNNRIVNIAVYIDERLQRKTGDGWRYDNMPADDQMYIKGLKGINETARLHFQRKFIQLTNEQQLDILRSVQHGSAKSVVCRNFRHNASLKNCWQKRQRYSSVTHWCRMKWDMQAWQMQKAGKGLD